MNCNCIRFMLDWGSILPDAPKGMRREGPRSIKLQDFGIQPSAASASTEVCTEVCTEERLLSGTLNEILALGWLLSPAW